MRVIGGLVIFFILALVPTILLNVPLLSVVFIARRRLDARLTSALLACGFVTASAWMIWQMEWFDVWRHGVPSTMYMLTAYVPSLAVSGLTGWLVGRSIKRRQIG